MLKNNKDDDDWNWEIDLSFCYSKWTHFWDCCFWFWCWISVFSVTWCRLNNLNSIFREMSLKISFTHRSWPVKYFFSDRIFLDREISNLFTVNLLSFLLLEWFFAAVSRISWINNRFCCIFFIIRIIVLIMKIFISILIDKLVSNESWAIVIIYND